MSVVKPDVVVISSDEEDDGDGERNLVEGLESEHYGDVKHDAVVISSDDEADGDGERNLDEGLDSEHDGDYSELDGPESDKEEEDDVEKSNEEECLDSCDKRRDRSDSFNQGGNDLQELSLFECKTYLRKHGMRVSGTKEECLQRIKEHGRLKDGSFESLYPRSSFSINCTGDACRGDVVLFKQNMYDSQRNIIGRRTVAGRIVKESYGASAQHTFSVEVLWSKWFKELNPLSILLVKGRNLYRFGTFRQPWKSETERSKVLREKHERGIAARHKRKLRETEFACGDTKGTKLRKVSHRGPSQSKHITRIDKHNDVNKNTTAHSQAVRFQNAELKKALPLTCHSDPNPSMYSNHHLQDASLPFSYDGTLLPNNVLLSNFSGYNHYNNEQGPNQALSQPPDHHHNNKPPTRRLTDGMVKSRFPKSSFSINCTGDARVGDTVLFKQHVYLGGTKAKKKRTVTGRIVKIRKCGSRDKHKFVIKVLWATHSKNLRRRFTLLVRSHNLYKFGTFRQPRKNEAGRSKRFKEKHAPATHKQKSRKTDIVSNKNKGTKSQKGSHKGPSSSKQPTQIAKQKSSKRKGASATPVKETKKCHKRKAVQLQKTKVKKSKQTFHQGLKPNPNLNLNPSLSTNPNPALSTTLNPTPRLNPNPDPNTNPNRCPNPNTRTNPNPNTRTNPNPNTRPNRTPNKRPNPTPNKRPNPTPNKRPNPTLNKRPNPTLNKCPNPNKCPTPNLNTCPNPNPNPNLNTHPHPNSYVYHDQLQDSSSSVPRDGTFMPNLPPIGLLPNQPPVWFSPSRPPFGFSGYGGQWGPNHVFTQSPGYYDFNQMIVQGLFNLLTNLCARN